MSEERLKKNKGFWRSMMRKDASSRHSMIEVGSQRSLDRSSGNLSLIGSGSQTSGSLDRLTASAYRPQKSPKQGFFRLKPKTPAFWKPLFQSSDIGASSHSQISLSFRDQCSQTDLTPTVEFGVQVVEHSTAHTRDVPVQTCCSTWDDGSRFYRDTIKLPTCDTTPAQLLDDFKCNGAVTYSKVNDTSCSPTLSFGTLSGPQRAQIHEVLPQVGPGLLEMTEIELDFNALPLMYSSTCNRFSSVRDFDDGNVRNPLSTVKDDFKQLRDDFDLDNFDVIKLEERKVKSLQINPSFEFLREDFSSPTTTSAADINSQESMLPSQDSNFSNSSLQTVIENNANRDEELTESSTSPSSSNISNITPPLNENSCLVTIPEQIDEKKTENVHAINSFVSLAESPSGFDSCKNLDQLEDEIIRSLYTPIQETEYDDNLANETSNLYTPNTPISNADVNKFKTEINPREIIQEDINCTPGSGNTDNRKAVNDKFLHETIENNEKITRTEEAKLEIDASRNDNREDSSTSPVSHEIVFPQEKTEAFIDLSVSNQKNVFVNVLEVRRSSWSGIEQQIPSPVLEVDETSDTSGKCSPVIVVSRSPVPKAISPQDQCKSNEDVPYPTPIISEARITLKPMLPTNSESKTNVTESSSALSVKNSGEPEKNLLVTPPPPPPLPQTLKPTSSHSPNHLISSNRPVSRSPTPNGDSIPNNSKSPMVLELEQKFLNRKKIANELEGLTKKIAKDLHTNGTTMPVEVKTWIPNKDVIVEGKVSNELPQNSHDSRVQYTNGLRNGHYSDPMTSPPNRISPQHSSQKHLMNGDVELSFSGPPVVTSEPPPPGAVLVDEKVTVEGDKIHTDKYYAIPVKEVLKEKKSTTKFIPAPEKYEGIGPTEEGIPVSLRQSVKKENMSDWYKTMYKTLHKIDNEDDTYVIGYSSDPEIRKEEKHPPPPKHELLSQSNATTPEKPVSPIPQVSIHKYATKSTVNVYSAHPRPIEDYEPGYSSVTDRELDIGSKRYFPTNKLPKTSYEFRDGYESDSSILKKLNQPDDLNFNQQKILYREVQQGGEIPQFGLRKPAPEKPKDPVVGPPPPQPHNYEPYRYPEVTRPLTLPPDYLNNNINNNNEFSQQANGFYATQMRNAIHSELQQKGFQTSPLSPNSISVVVKPAVKPMEKKMLARVLFDFVAETPKELNLKKDEIVSIRRELDKNWYEGERKGQVGIFPISYVEILPPEHVSPVPKKIQEGLAKVMYDFPAHNSIELQAKKDEEIHLIRKVDHNWYEARIGSRKGIIPRTYINVIHEPDTGFSKSQQPSLSPGSKDARSTSSMSPLSEASLSPHMKTNGVTPSQNGPPSQNGHVSRTKKGNKLIEPVLYKALYRYSPQNADELQLIEGDNVYVIEMCDDGWYVGTSVRTGELGIIPGNYMEKV